MKSSTSHNLQFARMRLAMLATVFTVYFLPALSATSHFRSQEQLSLSGPAADVLLHYGAATVGPSIHERRGISTTTADTVTRASIMWGSLVPRNPRSNSERGPVIPVQPKARDGSPAVRRK
jgi:hypothetical protein